MWSRDRIQGTQNPQWPITCNFFRQLRLDWTATLSRTHSLTLQGCTLRMWLHCSLQGSRSRKYTTGIVVKENRLGRCFSSTAFNLERWSWFCRPARKSNTQKTSRRVPFGHSLLVDTQYNQPLPVHPAKLLSPGSLRARAQGAMPDYIPRHSWSRTGQRWALCKRKMP